MTSATVTEAPTGLLAEECVTLTWTDAYTYVSKLSSVTQVFVTWADAAAGTAYIGVSGRTLTLNGTGVSGKKCYVLIKGRL
jgi:hypothetical protein